MVELDDHVLEETVHEGQSQLVVDVVGRMERAHPDEQGVSTETVRAYADALASERAIDVDPDAFLDSVTDRLVESNTWTGEDALYELGEDRVSRYPSRWHDALGDSTDVAAYVDFLQSEVEWRGEGYGPGDTTGGIRKDELLDVVAVIGGMDHEDARTAVQAARDEGILVEDADQHPQAGVYLSEDAEGLRDHTLDG